MPKHSHHSHRVRNETRHAFTLVEVLMVVAIIGILAGLIIPAVSIALTAVKRKAIALEVQAIASAVEQYKNKYGDYPPDGSDQAAFERHFRKVFPQIQSSEFSNLYNSVNHSGPRSQAAVPTPAGGASVMDPAESLVFCLGGYSSNPIAPFTGTGGPLIVVAGSSPVRYQYNPDRTNGFIEFKQAQLSLEPSTTETQSNDEVDIVGGANDAIPVYRPGGRLMPYVYFDSRTYSVPTAAGTYFNYYEPADVSRGVARPYKSANRNTGVTYSVATRDAYYRYAEDKSFQVISAGLDDLYGGVRGLPNTGTPMFYAYPSGESVNITIAPPATATPTFSRYVENAGIPSAQLDNATNFSEGILEDALEN